MERFLGAARGEFPRIMLEGDNNFTGIIVWEGVKKISLVAKVVNLGESKLSPPSPHKSIPWKNAGAFWDGILMDLKRSKDPQKNLTALKDFLEKAKTDLRKITGKNERNFLGIIIEKEGISIVHRSDPEKDGWTSFDFYKKTPWPEAAHRWESVIKKL
jgi:hypothetical protein